MLRRDRPRAFPQLAHRPLAPLLRSTRFNALVVVELHVTHHLRQRVDAVRHALAFVGVRIQHSSRCFNSQERTQPLRCSLRLSDQVFVAHQQLPLAAHLGQERRDVLFAGYPDQLRQLAARQFVRRPEEHLVQLRFFERPDHRARVTHQVHVQRIGKQLFRPPQHRHVQGVRRRLVHQHPLVAQLLL